MAVSTLRLLVCLPLLLPIGCGDGETPSATSTTSGGSGGAGGAGGASCGEAFTPAPASAIWCERLAPALSGARDPLVDLSAVHAGARFFSPEPDVSNVDQALAAALETAPTLTKATLDVYAKALPASVCAIAGAAAELGPASVTSMDSVAIVRPGAGEVALPKGTQAVLVDLRGLPSSEATREAIENAVSLALATPIGGFSARVRQHEGMFDEAFSPTNIYANKQVVIDLPEIAASGAEDLPLALLTEATLSPEAAEIAAILRVAGRALVVGEDLRVEVAEARVVGVGDLGLAYRWRTLQYGSDRFPDVIAADIRRADPECFAAEILAYGAVPPFQGGAADRLDVKPHKAFNKAQAGEAGYGEAIAALVAAHGALRTFFPYFATVGDILDERLVEVASAIPTAPARKEVYDALRRFGAAIEDGHNFVLNFSSDTVGYLPVMIEDIGGEAVVRYSGEPSIAEGDTIVSIDGVAAETWYETELARSSAATDGYRFDIATRQLTSMAGPKTLGLRDPDGNLTTVVANPQPIDAFIDLWVQSNRIEGDLSDLGEPSLYYINLDSYALASTPQFQNALAAAASSAGLVLDMRGYPGINHYEAAQRLIGAPFSSPIFRVPIVTGPDDRSVDESSYPLSPLSAPSYAGPVVLLVGHHSVSAAENFATMLVDAGRVTVIGRTSAGTNGNITSLMLPGNFAFSFTGMEVLHADAAKSVFHGVGIVPDIEVTLSAKAFQAGQDPELLAAIAFLTGS